MRYIIVFLLLAFGMQSCKKRESKLDFSSVHYMDINAQPTASVTDDDYQKEEWDAWILDQFKQLDTANLTNMGTAHNVGYANLYPNYCDVVQSLTVQVDTLTNIKVVIIDQSRNIRRQFSLPINRPAGIFNMSYQGMENGFYRLYYALSGKGNPFYYKAHIDLEIRK